MCASAFVIKFEPCHVDCRKPDFNCENKFVASSSFMVINSRKIIEEFVEKLISKQVNHFFLEFDRNMTYFTPNDRVAST